MPINPFWDFIQSNLDKKWSYLNLSANPNINWDIIRANPDKPWQYYFLSRNVNITWDIILAMPSKNWDYYTIKNRQYFTMKHTPKYFSLEYIKNLPDDSWCFQELSYNPGITWDMVQANPNKKWNYWNLSENPSITWEIVQANPDKQWNYRNLLRNPNITPKIINANRDKFVDIIGFESNELNHHPYFQSAHYKHKMTAQMHAAIYDELIMRACTPARTYQWNEGAADEYPEEYARECSRYK